MVKIINFESITRKGNENIKEKNLKRKKKKNLRILPDGSRQKKELKISPKAIDDQIEKVRQWTNEDLLEKLKTFSQEERAKNPALIEAIVEVLKERNTSPSVDLF